jgi:hypothetical protein
MRDATHPQRNRTRDRVICVANDNQANGIIIRLDLLTYRGLPTDRLSVSWLMLISMAANRVRCVAGHAGARQIFIS